MDDDSNLFPTNDVKAKWTEQLQTMLPYMPKFNIESAVSVSISLEEAASILWVGTSDTSSSAKKRSRKLDKEEDLSDLLIELAAKINESNTS